MWINIGVLLGVLVIVHLVADESEGRKISHVQTSFRAGTRRACYGVGFTGTCSSPAGHRRRHAHLPVGAVNWPAHWIPAANGLPVCSKRRLPARSVSRRDELARS